jgi:hypothetical protein
VPARGGIVPSLPAEYADPAEAELVVDLADRRIVRVQITGDEPVVVGA